MVIGVWPSQKDVKPMKLYLFTMKNEVKKLINIFHASEKMFIRSILYIFEQNFMSSPIEEIACYVVVINTNDEYFKEHGCEEGKYDVVSVHQQHEDAVGYGSKNHQNQRWATVRCCIDQKDSLRFNNPHTYTYTITNHALCQIRAIQTN